MPDEFDPPVTIRGFISALDEIIPGCECSRCRQSRPRSQCQCCHSPFNNLDERLCAHCTDRCREGSCSHCGESLVHLVGPYLEVGLLCRPCRNNHVTCSYDGILYNPETHGFGVCGECGDYVHCWREEEQYHDHRSYDYEDDEDDYESPGAPVFGYNYKPEPIFHPCYEDNVLYVGMELEVECQGSSRHSMAETVTEELFLKNGDEWKRLGYLKDDGSISHGFEIVTHPMRPDWFLEHFPWKILDWLREQGVRSYNTSSCGIHLHLSKDAFTPRHLWKFLQFHYRNPELCQQIGQRRSSEYASWMRVEDERRNTLMYALKKDSNYQRYVAVNLQPDDTIELRYFKGNLNVAAVQKNIEFVWALYDYTLPLDSKQVKAGALREEAFTDWLFGRNEHPELIAFLKRCV